MFCNKCGKENEDNVKFCAGCGAPMTPAEEAPVAAEPVAAVAVAVEAAPAAPAKPKVDFPGLLKKYKWILIAVLAVAIIAVAAVIIISNIDKEVRIADFLQIEEEGYDSLGHVTAELDTASLAMHLLGDKEVTKFGDADIDLSDEDEYEDWEDDMKDEYGKDEVKAVLKFCESIEISLDYDGKNGSLSNGDVVTVEIEWSKRRAEDMNLAITDQTFEHTIEKLTALASINVFDHCTLYTEGFDTMGYAYLAATEDAEVKVGDLTFTFTEGDNGFFVDHPSGDYQAYCYIQIDSDNYDLSNGDVLDASAHGLYPEELLRYGVKVASTATQMTVETLAPIVTVDLMSNITVNYTGINGNGKAEVGYIEPTVTLNGIVFDFENWTVTKDGDRIGGFSCYLSDAWNLTDGDVITASLSMPYDLLEDYGTKLDTETKDFTVSGLAQYLTDLSGVNANIYPVSDLGKDRILELLDSSWNYMVHHTFFGGGSDPKIVVEPTLCKVLLVIDDEPSSYKQNTVWFIYKATLNDSVLAADTEFYFAITNENLALYPVGEICQTESYMAYSQAYATYEDLYNTYLVGEGFTVQEIDAP